MSDDRQIQRIENQRGTVGFWNPLGRFTLNFSKPGAYDSQCTAILDDEMPAPYRKQGTHVIFSGAVYRNSQTPPPRLGGEEVFWIALDSIRPDSSP